MQYEVWLWRSPVAVVELMEPDVVEGMRADDPLEAVFGVMRRHQMAAAALAQVFVGDVLMGEYVDFVFPGLEVC